MSTPLSLFEGPSCIAKSKALSLSVLFCAIFSPRDERARGRAWPWWKPWKPPRAKP